MRLALSQYPVSAHDSFGAWALHTRTWVQTAVTDGAKVLVFPEYGSMELVSLLPADVQKNLPRQILELQNLLPEFQKTFRHLAQEFGVAILAPSFPVLDSAFAKPVNRAFFFYPDGKMDFQDKVHMTRFEDEVWGVGTGLTTQKVFTAFGVNFGVSICFDVEFPFAPHELATKGVLVLLAPSCTETMKGLNRVHVGARARAMENQYYVGVSQTVGTAPWSEAIDFNTGLAACYSTCDHGFPDDGVLAIGKLNKPEWLYCDLDVSKIDEVRKSGQVFNYRGMQKG